MGMHRRNAAAAAAAAAWDHRLQWLGESSGTGSHCLARMLIHQGIPSSPNPI